MKNYYVLALGLLLCFKSYAQMGFQNYRNIQNFNVTFKNSTVDLSQINGSPFLTDEFSSGKIIDTKKGMDVPILLRYDVLNDVFEIKINKSDTELKSLERSFNYEYQLNGEKFILIQSPKTLNELHYNTGNGYVAELTDSQKETVLYKRYFAEKKEGKKAQSTYQKDTPPSIDVDYRFIIKFGKQFVKAEAHKKRVLDAFPDQRNVLKKYIKTKKLKFRGNDDKVENQMVMLVDYYNSL